jgi:ent-kaurene oxidase
MFKVLRNDGDILVISNKHVDELRNLPEGKISAIQAHIKNLLGRFSTTLIMLESDLPMRALQQKLTPALASAVKLLQEELEYALEVEMPECDGEITLFSDSQNHFRFPTFFGFSGSLGKLSNSLTDSFF